MKGLITLDRQPCTFSSIICKDQGYKEELVLPSNIVSGVIQLSHNNNGDIELQRAGKQRHNENKDV
jgi:hypothetical protein